MNNSTPSILKELLSQRDELLKQGQNDEQLNDRIRYYQKLEREDNSK